ncbi:MAG TPA: hypothetical protein VES67_06500 [Vicinamibacterales bacterium]|nr:hypothetical protein [Vicinamibacterales bacterium]
MTSSAWLRRSLLLSALLATINIGSASAQTISVKNVAPDAGLEVTLGQATASGKADATGVASVTLNALEGGTTAAEMVVVVHVDACGTNWRVVLVERTSEAPPPVAGCTRREIQGAFVLRRMTSLGIDVSGTSPNLLIRQGPLPASWVTGENVTERTGFEPPTGLIVFGGGGLVRFKDAVLLFCGNVSQCTGKSSRPGFEGGVVFWITPYVGAVATYKKAAEVKADGSGNQFRFESGLDAEVLSIAGAVGGPVGRVRLYGQVGLNYHRAQFSTTQTTEPRTVTVDGAPVVLAGGTQTLEFQTTGWGWLFGGGAEIWITTPLAIYTDITWAGLKGDDRNGGEPIIDERVTSIMAGIRFRLGRLGR